MNEDIRMKYVSWMGLLMIGACSNAPSHSGVTPDSGLDSVAADLACAHDAETYCERLNTCAPFLLQAQYRDVETCKARDRLWCDPIFRVKDSALQPGDVDACATAVGAESCDEFLNPTSALEACRTRPGLRVNGAPCKSGLQCQSLHCSIPQGTSCGVCATRVAVGESCTVSSDCDNGRCRENLCVPIVGEGGTCDSRTACHTGLTCVTPDGTTASRGVCTKPIAEGGTCNPLSDACDFSFGLGCDTQSQTCKVIWRIVIAGQVCSTVDGLLAFCAGYGLCVPPADEAGICQATPADGATCNPDDDRCMWPASCVNGVCQPYDPSDATGCPG